MSKKYLLVILCILTATITNSAIDRNTRSELDRLMSSFLQGDTFEKDKFLIITGRIHNEEILDNIYSILMYNYTVTYFNIKNTRIESVEEVIKNHFSIEERLEIIIGYLKKYVFNEYLDSEINYISVNKYKLNNETKKRLDYATYLYFSLKTYTQNHNKQISEWEYIRDSLARAKALYSLGCHDKILLKAYKKLDQDRSYFELKTEILTDNHTVSLIDFIHLYFIYLSIDRPKESFSNELRKIKNKMITSGQ